MEKLKVGDRVKNRGYVNSRASETEYGYVVSLSDNGVDVQFDRNEVNRPDNMWYLSNSEVEHDRDMKVGDWVRYTRVDDWARRDEGEIGQISDVIDKYDVIRVSWVKEGRFNSHKRRYLVKIQPPEKGKTMNIKRKSDGAIVRGVTELGHKVEDYQWLKVTTDCGTYYSSSHWEPVEEWVTIEVDKHDWLNTDKGCGEFVTINRLKDTRVRWRYPK